MNQFFKDTGLLWTRHRCHGLPEFVPWMRLSKTEDTVAGAPYDVEKVTPVQKRLQLKSQNYR
jgi:hypothetical protein